MGDHPCHPHPGPVTHRPQVHRRGHALGRQTVADEPGGMPLGRHPGGPQVRTRHLPDVHGRQRRGLDACDHPGEAVGSGGGQRPRRPQGLPPIHVEAGERPGGGQGLHDRAAGIHPPLEVLDRRVRPAGGDGSGKVSSDSTNRPDAHPDGRPAPDPPTTGRSRCSRAGGPLLEGGIGPRPVQVRGADLHAVATGILDQGVRRVEAHGLGIQEPGAERRRVVELQPGTGVHEVCERHGVALREPVVGEGGQLLPDLPGDVGRDPALPRPVQEALVEGLHAGVAALGSHGLSKPVGLAGGESGYVHREAHELLLEQRDAEGSRQGVLTRRVEVGDLLLPVPAPDVGMDRPTLDRAGPDEGDLDHQVMEAAGPQPGQGRHLGPALDLEHPDGVGGADHVVDGIVLLQA